MLLLLSARLLLLTVMLPATYTYAVLYDSVIHKLLTSMGHEDTALASILHRFMFHLSQLPPASRSLLLMLDVLLLRRYLLQLRKLALQTPVSFITSQYMIALATDRHDRTNSVSISILWIFTNMSIDLHQSSLILCNWLSVLATIT